LLPGTPRQAGEFVFAAEATDVFGFTGQAQLALTVTVV
jgi:hypothetical protein